MDDHYFGAIPERVASFMKDLEIRALELGIPCKTRHNEVAPNQFELAPIFEECNLAVDHNMLIMSLMQKVARKHGFRCLLHEKPFDGINGSGKHNNWSLATDTGILLHAPGKDDLGNLRFITFVVETLMGVYKHNGLMKASIMSATNAHRLGGHEAPPMIISSFLGRQLTEVLEHFENSTDDTIYIAGKAGLKIDIPSIPELLIDNTDRNRTSPFAFTGNRFEFRAPGSEANCAAAMITLNAAVAEALVNFKTRVDALIAGGKEKNAAIIEILREDIKTCKPVRFDGNGYSEEWQQEAARRGLDVERSCPLIFDRYTDPDTIRMFESLHIMNRKELAARNDIKWETYTKKVQIEARIFGDLSINHIIPKVVGYQTKLAENVAALKAILPEEQFSQVAQSNLSLIGEISERIKAIEEGCEALTNARKVANKITPIRERAIAYHDTVEPLMDQVRYHIDKLEEKVDDEEWTLPKYREMLFMR
jgi:glutamine synthetase